MGQYLHFLQDTYSHREINSKEMTDDQWQPYDPTFGHVAHGHNPDCIPWNLPLARAMAAKTYTELKDFADKVLKRHPKDFSHCIYSDDLKRPCPPRRDCR